MKGWNRFVSLSVLLVIISSLGIPVSNLSSRPDSPRTKQNLAYAPHVPIIIMSNAEFITQASIEAWSGNGTEQSPYVIENFEIVMNETAIIIANTDVHFMIQNCHFECTNSTQGLEKYHRYCVALENVTNGMIEDCVVRSSRNSLGIFAAVNCSIISSYFEGPGQSVYIRDAHHFLFHNNTLKSLYPSIQCLTIYNNMYVEISLNRIIDSETGIGGSSLQRCKFVSNIITNATWNGLMIYESNDTEILNNTIYCIREGISLARTRNFTVRDNLLYYGYVKLSGEVVEDWASHSIQNNLVNDRPVLYLNGLDSMNFDVSTYGEVILANCTRCLIDGGDFRDSGGAVLVGFCMDCDLVGCQGQNLTTNFIALYYSTRCNISYSYFTGSVGCAFYMHYSNSCYIIEGYIESVWRGIDFYFSRNCIVETTEIWWVQNAIQCSYSIGTQIIGNHLHEADHGVYLDSAARVLIGQNHIYNCYYNGITLKEANHNMVTNNQIHNCNQMGIHVDAECYNNTFVNNILWSNSVSNALDDGDTSRWDDGISIGNHWDDYIGTGTYTIPGTSHSVDHFPTKYSPTTTEHTTPSNSPTTVMITSTSTTTTSTTPSIPTFNSGELMTIIGWLVTIGSVGIIILFTIKIIRMRRKS